MIFQRGYRHWHQVAIAFTALLVWGPGSATAQLRIVTYNPTGSPSTGIDVVLRAIGEETRNGFAKPIDVLLLQEQNRPASPGANSPSTDTQAFVTLLNNMYNNAGITYSMSNRTGNTTSTGDPTQTLVYRTQTVQLVADSAVGTSSTSGQPRQALRYQLRPVGYTAAGADFYVYNSHYKASSASQDPEAPGRREVEATAIRANADALGQGTHIIYAGDHNFYDYTEAAEPAFQSLIAAGNGQASDPINQIGTWSNNSAFAAVHTQSPCTSSVGNCGVTGGMDDRFDFQLVTGELMDSEGLSYISGSYHAFGNDGSTFNDDINDGNTVTFPGVTSYNTSQVLNALHAATDHIPVVADYQVPAWLQAVAGSVPSFLEVGQAFNLGVTVTNIAPVTLAIGADELDYSLTTSGSVTGSFLNQIEAAAGGSNAHNVSLNTSTVGGKTGTITVASTSQGVQNGTVNIPISFQVILSGDYNNNGAVDMADYALWRNGSALQNDSTPGLQASDYDVWRTNFGRTTSGGAGGELFAAVPEPSTLGLLLIGVCWFGGWHARSLRRTWSID